MKRYNFIFLAIPIICLFMVTSDFCMESDRGFYREACRKIDRKHKKEFNHFVLTQVTDHNALEMINKVQLNLKKHEISVQKKKEIAFSAIKIKHDVSDSVWNKCLAITDALYKFTLDTQWVPFSHTVHDPKMPQWFASMIKKQLIEIDINPQRINLCKANKGALSVMGVSLSWSYHKGNFDVEATQPGSIRIDYNELEVSDLDKEEGRCMLLAHIVKTAESMEIISAIKACGVKIKEKEYKAMAQLHFVQSAFEVALKNQRSAHCIRHYCKLSCIDIFSLVEHYKQLSKIEYCWKMLDWLQKYSGNNYHSIALFLTVKKGDVANSLYCLDHGMVVTQKIVDEAAKTEDSLFRSLLRKTYDDQRCSVCYQHPEDMRDMPCVGMHAKDFICWQCYTKLKDYDVNQKTCPICRAGCLLYDKVAAVL